MTALLKVELGRLLSRRLFRLVAVFGLLGVLAVDGLIAANSSNNIAAAQARAKVEQQQSYQSCVAAIPTKAGQVGPSQQDCDRSLPANQLKDCLAVATANPGAQAPTAAECQSEAQQNPYFNDPRFHFADHAKDLLVASAYVFMALGLVVAASLVGAEWQAGTFASLLTWEPRRQRVLAAKLTAAVIGVVTIAAPLIVVLEAGAALAADARGTTAGTTSQLMWQLASMYGRVIGLIALVTLIGAALAALTRHTVAVVAIVGGYLIGGELVGSIVSTWWRNHALAAHLLAFIQGKYSYYVNPPPGQTFSNFDSERYLHAGGAVVLVGIVTAVVVAAASVMLSRRDVT